VGQTYNLVVDGYLGAAGNYTINVACGGGAATPTRTQTKTATRTPTRTNTPGAPVATATATPVNTATPYVRRVRVGGAAYTDLAGRLWQADRAYSSGSWGYYCTTNNTYGVTNAIAATNDDPLYQGERYGMGEYRFDLPNGVYQVTLKFSENYFVNINKRRFSITIEGNPVLTDFDIRAAAGAQFTAVDRVFTVTVIDGQMNLRFAATLNYAKIDAIEVRQIL
jgi:chitinase